MPVSGPISTTFVCSDCLIHPFHFQFAVCACEAQDIVRDLIHRFKYRKMTHLDQLLSWLLYRVWRDPRIVADPPEMLTPVPLYRFRERERGFNQSNLLAQALSKRTGLPCKPLLIRTISTPSQTLLTRSQRRRNLRGAFATRNPFFNQRHIMLVDDVLTTGSTLDECSRALLAGGARAVSAIAIARA
jgi:ComF family protein